MMEERKFSVFRDGKRYKDATNKEAPDMTQNECFEFITDHQEMSLDWAIRHGGWSVRQVG